MVTDRALYWMAAGVLAFGLSHSLYSGRLGDLKIQTSAFADRITAQSDRYLAMTEMLFARTDAGVGRAQTTMARAETRLACAQSTLARRQADLARRQADQMVRLENMRVRVAENIRRVQITCPGRNLSLTVPEPVVSIDESF